jgi:hypothetical protein
MTREYKREGQCVKRLKEMAAKWSKEMKRTIKVWDHLNDKDKTAVITRMKTVLKRKGIKKVAASDGSYTVISLNGISGARLLREELALITGQSPPRLIHAISEVAEGKRSKVGSLYTPKPKPQNPKQKATIKKVAAKPKAKATIKPKAIRKPKATSK